MIGKWINSIFRGGRAEVLQQGVEEERKKRKETKMVDLAHEAMVERANEDRAKLEGLVRKGWPQVKREQFESKVRKKVWDTVREGCGNAGRDVVDEITDSITDRIVDVAEIDETYAKMFDKKNA